MGNETTNTTATTETTTQEQNESMHLIGPVRFFGIFLTIIAALVTAIAIRWVHKHRDLRIVKIHQPIFLLPVLSGLLIWELSVLPLSIDDDVATQRGCDIACMITEWLALMGPTLVYAALYSKLKRINTLFQHPQRFRRMQVQPQDVIKPFLVFFTINLVLLILWTVLDPIHWTRTPVNEEDAAILEENPNAQVETYGYCDVGTSGVGSAFQGIISAVNTLILVLVCCQAWKARRVDDEFSESKKLGIVLYNWIQLLIITRPLEYLTEPSDTDSNYYLQAGYTLAQCTSMVLVLWVPIYLHHRSLQPGQQSPVRINVGRTVVVTGLDPMATTTTTTTTSDANRDPFCLPNNLNDNSIKTNNHTTGIPNGRCAVITETTCGSTSIILPTPTDKVDASHDDDVDDLKTNSCNVVSDNNECLDDCMESSKRSA